MPIAIKQPPRNKISSSNINNKSNCSNSVNGGFRISSFPSTNKNQNVLSQSKPSHSTHNVIPKDKAIAMNLSHQSVFQAEENDLYDVQQFTESDIILNKKLLIT